MVHMKVMNSYFIDMISKHYVLHVDHFPSPVHQFNVGNLSVSEATMDTISVDVDCDSIHDLDQIEEPAPLLPVEQYTPSPPAYSPISSPQSQLPLPSLSTIQDEIDLTDTPWLNLTEDSTTLLKYCILTNIHPQSSRLCAYAVNPVSLKFTVIVHVDCTWQCFVGRSTVDVGKVPCLSEIPVILNSAADLKLLLTTLQIHKVCPGNPDEKYVTMVTSRKGKMKSRKGSHGESISCFIDSSVPVTSTNIDNETVNFINTVRTTACDIIIPVSANRCKHCIKY